MKRNFLRIFRPVDFIILFIFLLVTAASVLFLKTHRNKEARLIVTSSQKEYIYPLSKDRKIEIDGVLEKSEIVIHDGRAYFKSSPCKNKTCIQMGALCEENDWAACLPNDVFIRIE
ncbi:MAG: NusG domain II-containing protein [Treponema sp.]|nr:NusG domain II-containing protein [Treponema sp.]